MTQQLPAPPTFADVLAARNRIQAYLKPTPLLHSRALSAALGCEAYLKCENTQPIGAFKVRGGINLIAQMPEEQRRRGVVTASTGNHGQSIAYAAQLFGVRARILAPEGANADKVRAMKALGAEVVLHGPDFDAARLEAERLSAEEGWRYIHSANEPQLIAGVATSTLEALEQVPDLDLVIVPIGGGSQASGACLVAKAVNPRIRVVGVQAEGAPAVYDSWKAKELRHTEYMRTFAEGLATRFAFGLTFQILVERLDEFVLVSDQQMREAITLLLSTAHMLAEPAGASATAAAMAYPDLVAGKKVCLILSGANITLQQLRVLLDATP